MKNETKVFQPKYFKKFACTCDKCVYNCCRHNWHILIDKNTYDKYTRLDDEIGKEFLGKINVISQDPFTAVIVTNADGGCHFLDEKGFCSIQLKLGYDYLSRACRIHPRSISYIDGVFETFLELSCEEAVKVVLFEREPMMFEESVIEPDGAGKIKPNRMLKADKYTYAANGAEIFGKLRITAVALIQSRQYNLRVRMLLLCIFIKQAEGLLSSGRDQDVMQCANETLTLLGTGVYGNLADEMPAGIENDFEIVLDILKDMSQKGDERFNRILEQSLEGMGIEGDSRTLPESLREDYNGYYQKYFITPENKEYILENYIVNHILMEGFPFNYDKHAGVMANFAALLGKYNLIEFLLVGVCAYHKKFDEWNVIDCVSAFTRRYDHELKDYLMMK